MLRSLHIANYALIDDLHAEFSNGLVILTGETGAGKSIIVDALGLIIGERASTEAVRAGTDRAVVEGLFVISGNTKIRPLLESSGVEAGEELVVRREISSRGQSRCFVNDSPVTLTVMRQIGEFLVDLHGQHEHQSLLRQDTHGVLLDDFGGLEGMVEDYQTAFAELRGRATGLRELRDREAQLRERREFSAFQLEEIDTVAPQSGEEERLETELAILENAERLYSTTGSLYELLYEGDRSVRDLLVMARNQLHDLADIDPRFSEAARECTSAEAIVAELARLIQAYNARVEFAPDRLEVLRERLGRLSLLKKKYGGSIDAVLEHRERLAGELSLADNFEARLASLGREVAAARRTCIELAQRLSAKRQEVGRRLDRMIVKELKKLGIAHGAFSTRFTHREDEEPAAADGSPARRVPVLFPRGMDEVEFFLSTNLGEEERPLARVASGGEISRIMLAMKTILAKADRLPVLVFDEIDVGVSGRIAQAVGLSLKSLSGFHQVIAITHLPQIAGLADSHLLVEKVERDSRAVTGIRRLALEEQVREVARLMSGAEVTEAGLAGARELMGISPH